jgi:hypothetical protein
MKCVRQRISARSSQDPSDVAAPHQARERNRAGAMIPFAQPHKAFKYNTSFLRKQESKSFDGHEFNHQNGKDNSPASPSSNEGLGVDVHF